MMTHPIGIISALPQELDALELCIQNHNKIASNSHEFVSGSLNNVPVVMTLSGMGKVNAAIAAQKLISEFQVKAIILIGVAGGLNQTFEIGDVIIGEYAFQHDVGYYGDSFSIHPSGILPEVGIGTGKESVFYNLKTWPSRKGHCSSSEEFFEKISQLLISEQNSLLPVVINNRSYQPKIRRGIIATGDQFIANATKKQFLANEFNADAVEMEGGAIAQVAIRNKKPFLLVRTISDKAQSEAQIDFQQFFKTMACNHARLISMIFKEKQFIAYFKDL